jgi:26S proteasome regulatory subunit N5
MSDIAPRKQERDYTKEVDELLQQIEGESTASAKVDRLLILEKQARNAADLSSTSRLLVRIIEISYDAGDFDGLNVQLAGLSKRHGQLREATRRMVDRAMEYLDELDKNGKQDQRLKLIETLREVTEGKVGVPGTPRPMGYTWLKHFPY